MTGPGDYLHDMPGTAITETDAERLLSRSMSPESEFSEVAVALAGIDLDLLDVRLDGLVGPVSLRAATLAREAHNPARKGRVSRLTPSLARMALTAIILVGMTGMAIAADASAPGDLLYGVDRAMERLGVDSGGFEERIEEADAIAGDGRAAAALNHVADSLSGDSSDAILALHDAADRLGPNANAEQIKATLSEMFEWMTTTDAEGREFGQGVAERAKKLGNGNVNSPKGSEKDNNGKGRRGGTPPGQSGR